MSASATDRPAVTPRASAGRRRLVIAFVVLVPMVVFGILYQRHASAEKHRAQLQRIESWVARAQEKQPRLRNLLVGVHNSLSNPLFSPRDVPTDAVRALADELDATQGRTLGTVVGVLRFMGRLEEICPRARHYGPFELARMEFPAEAREASLPP